MSPFGNLPVEGTSEAVEGMELAAVIRIVFISINSIGILMKFTHILCGIALSSMLLSPAMAGEGKVLSSIATAGYTYVEVEQSGKTIWIAANRLEVAPGNLIRFDEGAMMTNFKSSSLDRTFPAVLFVAQVEVIAEK